MEAVYLSNSVAETYGIMKPSNVTITNTNEIILITFLLIIKPPGLMRYYFVGAASGKLQLCKYSVK